MDGRSSTRIPVLAVLGVLALVALMPVRAYAQEASSRYRVLVPNLEPQGDLRKNFGEDVAEELRDFISQLATHTAVPERELREALRKFRLDEDKLTCIPARQLATQINVQLVMCGSYKATASGFEVDAKFVDPTSGEEFQVPAFAATEREPRPAAEHIAAEFGKYVETVRYAVFCDDYISSQQWENAIQACDRAIELNPRSIATRYSRAEALWKLERNQDALDEMKRVLELSPIHENALQTAGFLSAQLGQEEDARRYYSQYLELNPADANMRMKIAYDLAVAGDPAGAALLIEEGVALDSTNAQLQEQLGNFAMSAAVKLSAPASGSSSQTTISIEAAELFQKALGAYAHVYAAKGAETDVAMLRNMVAANMSLENYDEAIRLSDQVLRTHGDEALLWSFYADALQKVGRMDDAIAALDSLAIRDASYANLAVRKGMWLLEQGRAEDAAPSLRQAAERSEQASDAIAMLFIAHGHTKGVTPKEYAYALRVFAQAEPFVEKPETREMLNFWTGFSIYQIAAIDAEPSTVETARKTLPAFQRALQLFQSSQSYARSQRIDMAPFLESVNQNIERQQLIIRRGG